MKKRKTNIKKQILKAIEFRNQNLVFIGKKNEKGMDEREEMRMRNRTNLVKSDVAKRLEMRVGPIIIPTLKKFENVVDVSKYPIETYKNIFNESFNTLSMIRMLILISNYERKNMLKQLLKDIKKFRNSNIIVDYVIFDDVSSYKINDPNIIINDTHRGKRMYWKTFDEMFKYCKNTSYDIYLFTPNDFQNYDFKRIVEYGTRLISEQYVFNIINDGRTFCWFNTQPINITDSIRLQFFTDCGFFTNHKTLELLEFTVNEIVNSKNNMVSSQVGYQLTRRINALTIPIFTPIKSIAYHGEHDSLMHPEIRKKDKLISKHE